MLRRIALLVLVAHLASSSALALGQTRTAPTHHLIREHGESGQPQAALVLYGMGALGVATTLVAGLWLLGDSLGHFSFSLAGSSSSDERTRGPLLVATCVGAGVAVLGLAIAIGLDVDTGARRRASDAHLVAGPGDLGIALEGVF